MHRVVTLVLACTALPCSADSFSIELNVTESASIDRAAEPISGGVPLPEGIFPREQAFALFRADGTELACQVSPLVMETDGTLRWILLDFQDDVAAGTTQGYQLQAVPPKMRASNPMKVTQTESGVTVDTGSIKFRVAKEGPFELFDSVRMGDAELVSGGRAAYIQLDGRDSWNDPRHWQPRTLTAGEPDSIMLEELGPLRVTIKVSGAFENDRLGARYMAWITAWSGSSRVYVKYKLCNSNPDQYTAIPVERSWIELELGNTRDQSRTILGAAEPLALDGDVWMHQGLLLYDTYQNIPGAVRAGSGDRVVWTGDGSADRPAGWIAAGNVLVCDRLFAANPARRLACAGGLLVLDGIAPCFQGPRDAKFNQDRRVGEPWKAEYFWLYDCTHHASEYLFDFGEMDDGTQGNQLAAIAQNRLWALAPGEYYSQCEVLGTPRFGTLEDERAAYTKWGWDFTPNKIPDRSQPRPGDFVAWEDNHYESEADSVQGLLLMYLRTGQRGWFDQAEAWARYHMDLQAWRTDGWAWKDGGIWFPQGGPQGNRPVREGWNFEFGPPWGDRKGNPDCTDLSRLSQGKSCYCHFYGSGLADFFCLTGDRDALSAAIDNVEQKDDEFRHYRDYQPGESAVGSIRGFGRGFEVMMRVLMADPGNGYVRDLCHLCARTLWGSPLLDERGFHCSGIGAGGGGMDVKNLSPPVKQWMKEQGIEFTTQGNYVDRLTKGDQRWPVHAMGGTWQHVYIQNGADLYATYFDDEDMRDFVIAFGKMSERYMLSPKCHQTWYYTFFDVPDRGMVFDPWLFEHADTKDGIGCEHSGWYTRFYPDACAKAYSLTGESSLLEKAREFWYYGSKREYRTKQMSGGVYDVNRFAGHQPPKEDTVLETARLFYEATRDRADTSPPAAIDDLQVTRLTDGRAEVCFTAPVDRVGRVVRYQLKVADLPIVAYEAWDPASDPGRRCNWWRAVNCQGEPVPSAPGHTERFVVPGLSHVDSLYFAVRSFDDSNNRSAISNVVKVAR